jgi:signal transduction histidine kinase
VARDPAQAREAIRRTARVILKQIQGLDRIAGDFANFARLPKRSLAPVDVAALVEDVRALHAGAAQEGVEVRSELAPDLPTVRWDEGELRRVLLNVVANAVQAIPGSGVVEIRARPAERDGRAGVEVEVSDTGPGIPPEHLERLFEPHFSTKTSGTGLGLAIVRGILDDMGGAIEVESRPGEGARFRLWWPCEPRVETGPAE